MRGKLMSHVQKYEKLFISFALQHLPPGHGAPRVVRI
jgi:hypothetical protein